MGAIISAILGVICKFLALPIAEDAIKGDLSKPTVIHDAIPTPQIDKAVGDDLVDGALPRK